MPDSKSAKNPSDRKPDWKVRPYREGDRERVRFICCETGFVGRPQEYIFEGREMFADLWSAYWTDYEPENAFVAEVNGKVEGYILGCLDTRAQMKVWSEKILPGVGKRMLRPGWWLHRNNRVYVSRMAMSYFRGEMKAPMDDIIEKFPAHLHTNIADPGLRGIGIGKAMMNALFDRLRDKGIKGVHLGTTDHNREAVPFYRHMGFETLFKHRLTAYDHRIDDPPLCVLYMGKALG